MKFVAFYDMAPGAMAKVKEHYPAHRARLDQFHARGDPFGLVGKWRVVEWNAAFL